MYSLFLLCAYVSFASATGDSELNFDVHNQCGCYRHDKCPNTYKPSCTSVFSNYEDFYLQNSAFISYPEVCNRWSLKGFSQNLTKSENGTLKMILYFSPLLKDTTTFELQLRYENQTRDICENSSNFHLLDSSHSVKHFTVQETLLDSCKKVIEMSFSFVFSGCYQLYITNTTNSGISGGCMTKPFFVTSSYYKNPLNNLRPKSSCSYQIQRQELVSTTFFGNFNGLNPYSTTVTLKSRIDLTLDDCSGSGNEAAKYIVADRGKCCHAIHHDSYLPRNMSYCPCVWEDDSTLECKFNGIENGNYCIVIEFIDPRCEKSTLWTKIERKYTSCAWFCNIEAKGHVSSIEIEPYKADNFYSTYIFCSLLLVSGTATIILFALYFFKIKKKRQIYTGENIVIMEKPCFINEDCEILFLYPRDCEEFMKAMAQFRILLKISCSCKVYDPWDEEIFDKVAESIETWSLPLIKNKNVKIIVVLTECSKVIEGAYIDDKHSITYRNSKAFDKIFGQSLKALNEYFAIRSDSYQRVFVVRLDETPVINMSFHFNCSTVYILPHGLQNLINDLQNGNSIHMNKENIILLETAIQEYLIFKQQHPNYLNEIVKVNSNSKIIKLLKN